MILANNSGYSLYLVLVIMFVAGVLFTVSIRTNATAHILSVRHAHSLKAELLAKSGIARAEYFLNGGDGHDINWETGSYEEKIENYGSIRISCSAFGSLAKISSVGNRFESAYTINGMMGRDVPQNLSPVITLTGHVGGLVLAQGSTITGSVVLHHGDVTRGNNSSPIPGSEKWVKQQESPALPFDIQRITKVSASLLSSLNAARTAPNAIQGSVTLSSPSDTLLERDTLVIRGDCEISTAIADRTIIVSGELTITNKATCSRSIFICDSLIIADGLTGACLFFSQSVQNITGGTHSSQFFANDSIIIGENALFEKCNIWYSHRMKNSDTTLTGGILFPPLKTIYGHALCITDSLDDEARVRVGPAIVLGERSTFNGCLITDGDISMKEVAINGQIYSRSVVTADDKVSYKNWLLGCRLKKLDADLPFPLLGELPAKVRLADWDK